WLRLLLLLFLARGSRTSDRASLRQNSPRFQPTRRASIVRSRPTAPRPGGSPGAVRPRLPAARGRASRCSGMPAVLGVGMRTRERAALALARPGATPGGRVATGRARGAVARALRGDRLRGPGDSDSTRVERARCMARARAAVGRRPLSSPVRASAPGTVLVPRRPVLGREIAASHGMPGNGRFPGIPTGNRAALAPALRAMYIFKVEALGRTPRGGAGSREEASTVRRRVSGLSHTCSGGFALNISALCPAWYRLAGPRTAQEVTTTMKRVALYSRSGASGRTQPTDS